MDKRLEEYPLWCKVIGESIFLPFNLAIFLILSMARIVDVLLDVIRFIFLRLIWEVKK